MNMKNLVLAVGIFIIYMLMLGNGIEAFYESPKYGDFCDESEGPRVVPAEINETKVAESKECYDNFNDAQDAYSNVVFIITIIAGVFTLIIGYFVLSVEPVGSALIASGIGAIFYGSAINWRNFSDIWRFLLLAVALVLLIWLALRLNKPGKRKK